MSHIVEIKTEVNDPEALTAACRRVGAPPPENRTVKFYDEKVASGFAVDLDGWKYPVVFTCVEGEVVYDDFNGHWGDRKTLDGLLQMYAVEKTRIEARKAGHSVMERLLDDGRIRLSIVPARQEVAHA